MLINCIVKLANNAATFFFAKFNINNKLQAHQILRVKTTTPNPKVRVLVQVTIRMVKQAHPAGVGHHQAEMVCKRLSFDLLTTFRASY